MVTDLQTAKFGWFISEYSTLTCPIFLRRSLFLFFHFHFQFSMPIKLTKDRDLFGSKWFAPTYCNRMCVKFNWSIAFALFFLSLSLFLYLYSYLWRIFFCSIQKYRRRPDIGSKNVRHPNCVCFYFAQRL